MIILGEARAWEIGPEAAVSVSARYRDRDYRLQFSLVWIIGCLQVSAMLRIILRESYSIGYQLIWSWHSDRCALTVTFLRQLYSAEYRRNGGDLVILILIVLAVYFSLGNRLCATFR